MRRKILFLFGMFITTCQTAIAQKYLRRIDGGNGRLDDYSAEDMGKELLVGFVFLVFVVITYIIKEQFERGGKDSSSAWIYAIFTAIVLLILFSVFLDSIF